jgi:sugar lactone lactonase YvrE
LLQSIENHPIPIDMLRPNRLACLALFALTACATRSPQQAADIDSTANVPAPATHVEGSSANATDAAASTLIPVYKGQRVWNGVATTADGQAFVSYPQADGPGMQAARLDADGTPHPFPDASWQSGDIAHAFLHVNALRIGPDGKLWIVDAGAPGIGKPAVEGAARIFRIDPASGQIERIYTLSTATRPLSYIDDIRFHGRTAYLTDAGAPGLIVLNLDSGTARRVLDNHPSAIAQRPMFADGKPLTDADGKPLRVHADQLEVSPDGKWLYFQPASGPLARIETRFLDDPSVTPRALASRVQPYAETPTTGGTAIDSAGNIYVSDTNQRRILEITPDGKTSTLVADARLIWSDAMWIDAQGYLWIPASQQNLTPGFDGGKMDVHFPVWIYKLKILAKPSPIDHS